MRGEAASRVEPGATPSRRSRSPTASPGTAVRTGRAHRGRRRDRARREPVPPAAAALSAMYQRAALALGRTRRARPPHPTRRRRRPCCSAGAWPSSTRSSTTRAFPPATRCCPRMKFSRSRPISPSCSSGGPAADARRAGATSEGRGESALSRSPARAGLSRGGRGVPRAAAPLPHRGPEGPVAAPRGGRQGRRTRQRPLGHLRPRLPRLPPRRRGAERDREQVFLPARIERLKRLLDDLHSRLNSGWSVVRAPARRLVRGRAGAPADGPGALGAARARRRAPPDGHLAPAAGGRQRAGCLPRPSRPGPGCATTCGASIWRRYRRWSVVLGAALFVLVLALPHLISAYETGFVQTALASALVAIAGAVGITKVSILLTVRGAWTSGRSCCGTARSCSAWSRRP